VPTDHIPQCHTSTALSTSRYSVSPGTTEGHQLSPYCCYLGAEADPHLTTASSQGVAEQ